MAAAHVVNGSSGPRRIPLCIGFLPVVPRFWINIIAEDSLYTSSFQVERRLTCVDIAKNPVPKVKRVSKISMC